MALQMWDLPCLLMGVFFCSLQIASITEGCSSPDGSSGQTTLVSNTFEANSDSCSHSELSNLDSPSRLSPLEDETNTDSLSPLSQIKMKRMLELDDSYFVPISHDQKVSPEAWFPPAVSNNRPSAFTKVKSSQNEITSNNNNTTTKQNNLIKLNHIKSAFVKSESYGCLDSRSSSPGSVGQMFSWKKRIKREVLNDEEDSPRNGADPMVSSVNVSPLGVKEELSDDEEHIKVSFFTSCFVGKFTHLVYFIAINQGRQLL